MRLRIYSKKLRGLVICVGTIQLIETRLFKCLFNKTSYFRNEGESSEASPPKAKDDNQDEEETTRTSDGQMDASTDSPLELQDAFEEEGLEKCDDIETNQGNIFLHSLQCNMN